jgi:hypothetical protein
VARNVARGKLPCLRGSDMVKMRSKRSYLQTMEKNVRSIEKYPIDSHLMSSDVQGPCQQCCL